MLIVFISEPGVSFSICQQFSNLQVYLITTYNTYFSVYILTSQSTYLLLSIHTYFSVYILTSQSTYLLFCVLTHCTL